MAAVAGKEYCILAADTRMMDGGYQIHTRNLMRIFGFKTLQKLPLPDKSSKNKKNKNKEENGKGGEFSSILLQPPSPVIVGGQQRNGAPFTLVAAAGCEADCNALQRQLTYQINAHLSSSQGDSSSRSISTISHSTSMLETKNVAQLLSKTLYSRRNFPYYSFCVVGGLDQDGTSRVYVYDAIGSMEQVAVATAGTGRELLQPILDRLFSSSVGTNRDDNVVDCSADEAIMLLTQAYHAVTERDIGVGDSLVLCVLSYSKNDGDGSRNCRIVRVPLKTH